MQIPRMWGLSCSFHVLRVSSTSAFGVSGLVFRLPSQALHENVESVFSRASSNISAVNTYLEFAGPLVLVPLA